MAKLRPSGGYRELRSFQIATIIYDATYWFCERFLDSRSRMGDQMVQAARSGRQNIAEGSPRRRYLLSEPNFAWSTSPAPASRNCCSTTRTSCGTAASRNGRRMPPKRWPFAG